MACATYDLALMLVSAERPRFHEVPPRNVTTTCVLRMGMQTCVCLVHVGLQVMLGASAVLSNGTVLSRAGSAAVAMTAHASSKPVLVCCEAFKVGLSSMYTRAACDACMHCMSSSTLCWALSSIGEHQQSNHPCNLRSTARLSGCSLCLALPLHLPAIPYQAFAAGQSCVCNCQEHQQTIQPY